MSRHLIAAAATFVLAYACIAPAHAGHAEAALSPEVSGLLAKAQAGDSAAQFLVGAAFDRGQGAPQDSEAAKRWYLAAAEQGHADAQNSLGSALQEEKSFGEALGWYEKAAAHNHAHATNSLGYLYDLGLGVAQDRRRAFDLYSRAADLGWAGAMWNLAIMHGAGQLGAAPDLVAACVWTVRAGQYAGPDERDVLAQVKRVTPVLQSRLSQQQLASCWKQARSWTPSLAAIRSDLPRSGR